MKKIFGTLVAIVSVFTFVSKPNAEQIMGMEMVCERGKNVCYNTAQTKVYTGSKVEFNTTLVDYDDHTKVLVEGEDYDKVYVTTRKKGFNPPADAFENPEKYSDDDFVTPGWVIEIIRLKGKYVGVIANHHGIAHYVYVYGDIVAKWKGTQDPELKGTYYYLSSNGYTSTDTITKEGYKVDLSKYTTVTREEGETPGIKYTTTAKVDLPKEAALQKVGANQYYIALTVPAYFQIEKGYLLIYETEANYEVKYIDEETGKEIKETETRIGKLGKKVEVTEDDYKIDGYEFDADSTENITSVEKLTEDGATLVLNFKKITEDIENGQGGDDVVVVQTGSDVDYSIMTSAFITISLIGLAIYSNRKHN